MIRGMCAVVVAAGLAATAAGAEHTMDNLETVKANLAAGKAVLVDVREGSEWAEGRLAGARHLALSDLKAGVPAEKLKAALPAGKIVYLHCAAGRRCLAAADVLQKHGYDVRPLKPGYMDLLKAGFEKAK